MTYARLAYIVLLLAALAIMFPFLTPDMPWWAGLAWIVGFFACIGVIRTVEDIKDARRRTPQPRLQGYRQPLKAPTRVLRR